MPVYDCMYMYLHVYCLYNKRCLYLEPHQAPIHMCMYEYVFACMMYLVYICLYECIYVCMCMYVSVSLLHAIITPHLIIFV